MRAEDWIEMPSVFIKGGCYWAAALISPDGEQNSVVRRGRQRAAELSGTPLLERCTYFQEVLGSFDGAFRFVRLLRMEPSTVLRTHIDLLDEEYSRVVRIHIPIVTNDDSEMIYSDQKLHMEPGECWYVDTGFAHSARNRGRADRVHLVIDTAITEKLERLAGFDILEYRKARIPEYFRDYQKHHAPSLPRRILARMRGRKVRDKFVDVPMDWWKKKV